MYYRRKILLALLQTFGGSLSKMDFQKYLFLLNHKKENPFFQFIPYKYGCFSFQANQDMSTMIKYNLVEEEDKHWKIKDKTNFLSDLNMADKIFLTNLFSKFGHLKGTELVRYVYKNHPYYAIHSNIAESILSEEEYKTILTYKPQKNDLQIFTIGYEGKTVEYFTNELIKEDVRALCDIRKNPISMKYGFSKNQLKFILENVGIKYFHFPELGIASDKRQNLNSREDYDRLFLEYEQTTLPSKIKELKTLSDTFLCNKRIALMCFEADPNCCHRSRTVKALAIEFNNKYSVKNL